MTDRDDLPDRVDGQPAIYCPTHEQFVPCDCEGIPADGEVRQWEADADG